MPVKIPQSLKTMLEDKAYGHVVTFNAQGKPEITMVWMDVEGDELLFNTAEGRRKPDNIRRDPRVIVSVQDRNNPQAYAVFHGKGRESLTRVRTRTLTSWPNVFLGQRNIHIGGPLRSDWSCVLRGIG